MEEEFRRRIKKRFVLRLSRNILILVICCVPSDREDTLGRTFKNGQIQPIFLTQVLEECWTSRNDLYQKHLDYLKWKQDIGNIEVWLDEMERKIDNDDVGKNLSEVDDLIGEQTNTPQCVCVCVCVSRTTDSTCIGIPIKSWYKVDFRTHLDNDSKV